MKTFGKLYKYVLIIFMILFGLNASVFAENPPIPSTGDIQNETNIDATRKIQLKAPIPEELTEEEKARVEQEAKLKEELTNENSLVKPHP